VLVVDGLEGDVYDAIDNVVFSPDSKRIAYTASRGSQSLVVVNGVAEAYDVIVPCFHAGNQTVPERIAHLVAPEQNPRSDLLFDSDGGLAYVVIKGSIVARVTR
jgi:hypothetical protein